MNNTKMTKKNQMNKYLTINKELKNQFRMFICSNKKNKNLKLKNLKIEYQKIQIL